MPPQAESQTPQPQIVESMPMQWFVLRDLKRSNAKKPAYIYLADQGFEVFTPMRWQESTVNGKRKKVRVPAIPGMLFAHTSAEKLTPLIEITPTLQYIYMRGAYCKPMVVRDAEMDNFIRAVEGAEKIDYPDAETLNALTIGKTVKITGGPLDGVTGRIVKLRGSRKKRIVVSIPEFVSAVVEISAGEIKLLD